MCTQAEKFECAIGVHNWYTAQDKIRQCTACKKVQVRYLNCWLDCEALKDKDFDLKSMIDELPNYYCDLRIVVTSVHDDLVVNITLNNARLYEELSHERLF